MRHTLFSTLLLVASLALSGCAVMPAELAAGGPYLAIWPAQARGGEYEQRRVRWGGAIIQTLPQGQRTCFEMIGLALNSLGEPLDSDATTGRFMACADGFFDPAIYSTGRFVTFTGRVKGSAPHTIANETFEFSKLEAGQVYLWPKRSEVIYVPYPTYGYPYYDYYGRHPHLR